MAPETKTYWIHSGEGCWGTWQTAKTTELGIKQLLTRERCNGDRWASAYSDAYELADGGFAGYNIETGDVKSLPQNLIETV